MSAWGSDSDDDGRSSPVAAARGGGDDVWGSDGDEEVAVGSARRDALSVRDEKSARNKHWKEGFKETLAQAREDSLQEGFGDGFKEGFHLGLRSGRLVGLATTLGEVMGVQPSVGVALKALADQAQKAGQVDTGAAPGGGGDEGCSEGACQHTHPAQCGSSALDAMEAQLQSLGFPVSREHASAAAVSPE
ncbi:hypothetical protein T484DRAFT_1784283 [Baffinella frigidus]|nr:hypothetical protein T484DRAFT_1784283 [Cryptophyta sp. CCMP2293]